MTTTCSTIRLALGIADIIFEMYADSNEVVEVLAFGDEVICHAHITGRFVKGEHVRSVLLDVMFAKSSIAPEAYTAGVGTALVSESLAWTAKKYGKVSFLDKLFSQHIIDQAISDLRYSLDAISANVMHAMVNNRDSITAVKATKQENLLA